MPPPPTPPPANQPPTPGDGARPRRRETALKRTVVRPGSSPPDPVDAAYVSDRLTALTHELANLLDGSLRCLCLARRAIERTPGMLAEGPSTEELGRQLATVQAAMEQMAGLVRSTMTSSSKLGSDASAWIGGLPPAMNAKRTPGLMGATMADAIRHAVEVMTPLAEEKSIRLSCDVSADLTGIPAGPIYGVIANTVRNSIEAIERTGRKAARDGTRGTIEVSARIDLGSSGRAVVIEVIDDGAGPPKLPKSDGVRESVFRLGFTTKPGGSGVGLAISRDVVQELGGTITLEPLPGEKAGKTGAVLRVKFPVPARGGPNRPAV